MADSSFIPSSRQFTKTDHSDTYPFIDPTKLDLAGLSVLIVGASRGIGEAIATSYAAAGASQIAIAARKPPTSLVESVISSATRASRPRPTVLPLSIDVTSESSIAAAVETITASFGTLDILINNAGTLEKWTPIADSDPSAWWDSTMTINVRGPYLVSRAFLPLLLRGTHRTILNTSSIGALHVYPGASAYQTSKFALCRLTEFLDVEYKDKGLVAIAFHPGGVVTDLAQGMPAEMMQWLQDKPALPGDTVAWLSKERREWLAGRYLSVNWDMQELEAQKERIVEEDLLKFRLAI